MSSNVNDHKNRSHALLSASSSHRWLKCPPSALVASRYPSTDTVYTREGTVAHEVAEAVARGLEINPGEEITPEMISYANGYRDYIKEQIRDPDAVVLLEQRLDFSDWVPGGFGTGDCIIIHGDTLDVIDYKYGRGVQVSAENNSQMMLYGLGAIKMFGYIYDIKIVKLHIYQPRIDSISVSHMTVGELLAWGDMIKPIAAQAEKGDGDYVAGDHCRFCPHAGACPTLADACTQVVDDTDTTAIPTLSAGQIAEILKMESVVSSWLKAVKDRAFGLMMDGAVVPGYKLVEGRPGNRKWSDEDRVTRLLLGAGYKQDDITETKLLSPAGIDKLIGKNVAADLLSDLIDRAPGSPTIAAASDPRRPYDRLQEAINDFNN